MLKPDLHMALGLETVNPEILLRLNKQMTTEDFSKISESSISFLPSNLNFDNFLPLMNNWMIFNFSQDRTALHYAN